MNLNDSPHALLEALSASGYQVRLVEGKLKVRPADLSPEFQNRIKAQREGLIALIKLRDRVLNQPDSLELLRAYAPCLWRPARLHDGRIGMIWGVTGHGVLVSPGPGMPTLTLPPDRLEILEDESAP